MSDLPGSQIALEVRNVAARLRELVTQDVSALAKDEFMDVLAAAGEMDRLNGTFQSKVAGDLSRRSAPDLPGGGMARTQGHGNAGKMIEDFTGGSAVGSRRRIEAGEAFNLVPNENAAPDKTGENHHALAEPKRYKWPHVAQASMAGELSADAAAIIVQGLKQLEQRVAPQVLDECEKRLVDKARTQKLNDVRRTVTRTVAKFDPEGTKERQRHQHAERYFTWKQDFQGVVKFSGVMDAVTAAPILTVIEQMVTRDYRNRRDQDPTERDQRTVGQMRADALFNLCRHALGCTKMNSSGVRTSLIVRMDLEDLRGPDDGLARIDGIDTPVSVSQVRRLAGDMQFIPEVLAGDGRVLDLGHEKRKFQWWQRVALVERDGGCAKCHAPPEHCEAHHIKYWRFGGETNLDNGVMLCTRCHTDVHTQGWEIEIEGGQVSFIPPSQIDPDREPQPGGLAALDIGDIPAPSAYPDDWEITDELEAKVREWEREAGQQRGPVNCECCGDMRCGDANEEPQTRLGLRA